MWFNTSSHTRNKKSEIAKNVDLKSACDQRSNQDYQYDQTVKAFGTSVFNSPSFQYPAVSTGVLDFSLL